VIATLPTRRLALAGGLALAAAPAWAAVFRPERDDMALGNPRARVTVIEYASTGCPHCAKWANEVFPAFKAQFIDTGKVRFVMRECLTGDGDLAATGFMLARCAGPANYFPVVDTIFKRQADMFQPGASVGGVLREIGKSYGLTDAAIDTCLTDPSGFKAVQARSDRHLNLDKVASTPTFDVNGKVIEGFTPLPDLAAAIAAARRKG
jgi:protein-disulfide isomerase